MNLFRVVNQNLNFEKFRKKTSIIFFGFRNENLLSASESVQTVSKLLCVGLELVNAKRFK